MLLFVFKQKTAYEMRISDWSSDVCSSDLESKWPRCVSTLAGVPAKALTIPGFPPLSSPIWPGSEEYSVMPFAAYNLTFTTFVPGVQIGRASCRERVCQYV